MALLTLFAAIALSTPAVRAAARCAGRAGAHGCGDDDRRPAGFGRRVRNVVARHAGLAAGAALRRAPSGREGRARQGGRARTGRGRREGRRGGRVARERCVSGERKEWLDELARTGWSRARQPRVPSCRARTTPARGGNDAARTQGARTARRARLGSFLRPGQGKEITLSGLRIDVAVESPDDVRRTSATSIAGVRSRRRSRARSRCASGRSRVRTSPRSRASARTMRKRARRAGASGRSSDRRAGAKLSSRACSRCPWARSQSEYTQGGYSDRACRAGRRDAAREGARRAGKTPRRAGSGGF